METSSLTASELSRLVTSREISARESVQAFVSKANKYNPLINCFIHFDENNIFEQAEAIDGKIAGGENPGRLAGVPVAIKDNILALGSPATAGSRLLRDFFAPYEGVCVSRLRDEDAIIFGKTNLDEFGMGSSGEYSSFGPILNPWNPGRVAGGSSGGSAAAVASGMATAALGSDTGGSVRQPASLCGVAGMRPTYGLASRHGLIAFASSLDQVGPVARDTRDLALLMSVICGHDVKDQTSLKKTLDFAGNLEEGVSGMKIGVAREYLERSEDAHVRSSFDSAIEIFEKLGAELTEVSLPDPEAAVAAYYVIATAEASSNLGRYTGVVYGTRKTSGNTVFDMIESTRENFGAEVKRRILLGTFVLSSGYYDKYYLTAQKARNRIRGLFDSVFGVCEAVILPTSPFTAFRPGEKTKNPLDMYLCDLMTTGPSLAGLPALSIPCGFDDEGLPVGLQITSPPMSDGLLLRIGRAFEKESGIFNRTATLNGVGHD